MTSESVPERPSVDEPGVASAADANGALQLFDVEAAPPGTYGELEPESPPLVDQFGRVRLSFSRINTYQNCPRKFRYGYVDRVPSKPSPHLSFGTSLHNALEAFYDRKLPQTPTEQELLEFLYVGWDSSGFRDMSREEQVRFYRHGQDVLRRFHQRNKDHYRLPATTEAWFELPFGQEAVVVGSIDRVDVDEDGQFHIIDYKTNRKAQDRSRVAGSLQLAIYALACRHLYGSLPTTVSLDFIVPGVTVTVDIGDIDLDAAHDAVLTTAAAVRAQQYEPTPNRLCDWCDFRSLCPAWPTDGEPETALGPAVQQLRQLRRQVARDVRTLRELEAGVDRLTAELSDGLSDAEPSDRGPSAGDSSEPASANEPPVN